jgi:hypothetical protein
MTSKRSDINSKAQNTKREEDREWHLVQEVLERAKWPTFLMLLDSTISVTLFNYSKICALDSMVTLPTIVTVVEKWF